MFKSLNVDWAIKNSHASTESLKLIHDFNFCFRMDIKNWLTNEKNLDLSHLEIFNFEKTGRGVRATRDILENEEIISIPYEILITKDFCSKNVEELKKWIYFFGICFS